MNLPLEKKKCYSCLIFDFELELYLNVLNVLFGDRVAQTCLRIANKAIRAIASDRGEACPDLPRTWSGLACYPPAAPSPHLPKVDMQ